MKHFQIDRLETVLGSTVKCKEKLTSTIAKWAELRLCCRVREFCYYVNKDVLCVMYMYVIDTAFKLEVEYGRALRA